MIITRTPFRVSFFGGGTDYPEWIKEFGGSVLGCAINKYCYISLRYLPPFFPHRYRIVYSITETCSQASKIKHPAVRAVCGKYFSDRGVEIHHDGDLPARSGMGSSSSFSVGLLNAVHGLRGELCGRMELAKEAVHLEQKILGETVGSQDQVLASFGNLNYIRFLPTGEILVRPLTLTAGKLQQLFSHCMLFFTGTVRTSSKIASTYAVGMRAKKRELQLLPELVSEACQLISSPRPDWKGFGGLLDEAWQMKRAISRVISNSKIDSIYRIAKNHGAWGGKILGAGGGGFFLIFAPPEVQPKIRNELGRLLEIPFDIDRVGSQIVFYDPEIDYRKLDSFKSRNPRRRILDLTGDSWKGTK
ncbi:MAG: kinase [Verrucomicrobia bacterium]|nr:kinase [Verrucomicrobiota bacterium]